MGTQVEKDAIRNQLAAHSQVIKKSHHLLAKQNNLIKQRESKIYSLVEKQSTYLDSMANLRNIQIGMDEDVAKKMLNEEAEAEERRKKELEEQRKRDEEFIKNMLLQEKAKGGGGGGGHKKQSSMAYNNGMRASQSTEQMMEVSNANSRSNLSQQIASVAL